MSSAPARPEVVDAFRRQVGWCEKLGSPFTARLLAEALSELEAGGPIARLLGQWPGDPIADALALRLAGALHALVLTGADPALAALYPAPGRDPGARAAVWRAAGAAMARDRPHFERMLEVPPQTNEVGRSAVLLGGFLAIAHATGMPLRLIEIGASAGLNLVFDRFHFRLGSAEWGDPASPVSLAPAWSGGLPPLAAAIRIAAREGCDLRPGDVADDAQVARLKAYVWPDQFERLARLDGAVALARAEGVRVAAGDALAWLMPRLAGRHAGVATVVYHSIFWQYLPAAARHGIERALSEAGARADRAAPLAWLRFEPDSSAPPPSSRPPALTLTLWPDGTTRTLAHAHYHGASVTWL